MKRTGKLLSSFLLLAAMLMLAGSPALAEVKIGVLAKRGAPEAMKEWGAMGAYLAGKIGDKVAIVPLKFDAIDPAVKNGTVDFLLANPSFFVSLEKKYQMRPIATMINSRNGKALKEFGGVILVRKDSPIKTMADLKGKKFMCVKYSSLGGAQMAWRQLLASGIDPRKDFASFLQGEKHDNVVLAVLNGTVDAGTVRSDTLERMAAEGKIKMADFRVINQIKDGFPFVHSTPLYPEWPMAALSRTGKDVSDKVAAALMAMPSDSPAAHSAQIVGWTKPADYKSVTECLKALGPNAVAGE
ncbi:MAG: phosphate/phosphite/phosphonate ABC transporter substrate-binding protein [Desulfobacteraceae bacterium]|nr:phosphate/phosphite/phosphonate ABC transporter substrate-binding protein [Desulfobacteraceae bacterium]